MILAHVTILQRRLTLHKLSAFLHQEQDVGAPGLQRNQPGSCTEAAAWTHLAGLRQQQRDPNRPAFPLQISCLPPSNGTTETRLSSGYFQLLHT